ncbi:MAG: hypothetical protein C5B50_25725 [Verrucomicrobia bacterium]|nr:MAG: hypothetical protein C5B50_25725 [Verrucomicrobiota bacterium]
MSTRYPQALQERISSLAAEYAQLEKQHAAVVASLPAKPTREQKRQHMKDWLVSSQALQKVEQRLRHAKRLLARTQGDEYVFQKT